MKRRLINAYDSMIMPERCAQKLEHQLQLAEENRRAGYYTRIITPEPEEKYGWIRTAVAACLMLTLFFVGSAWLLQVWHPAAYLPAEGEATREEAVSTPADHYAEATDLPADRVENFAKIVCYNILQKNWDALKDKVKLPLTVQGEEVTDWDGFVERMKVYFGYYVYTDRLEHETCRAMFCNWQGIAMADGLIWINEVGGELKITAIDGAIQEKTEETVQKKQVPGAFAQVLSGEEISLFGIPGKKTLAEHCADMWGEVVPAGFAVVDMDADGICEIVVSARTAAGETGGYLVLRQAGEELRTYSFRPGEMTDLKKDGSFFRRDRDYRLVFNDEESWNTWYTEELENQPEKPMAQWHAWPCLRPDLLLRSYEYVTGTGWTQMPGNPYYYFQSIVRKIGANDIQTPQYWGTDTFVIEDDRVFFFDPDAPGTVMYGTLTEENGYRQFDRLGFYMATEGREYGAEARNLLSEEPEYWVDVLPDQEEKARQVSSPEEMIAFFGYTPVPEDMALRENRAIRDLMDSFAASYYAGDAEAIRTYLTEDYRGSIEIYSGTGTPELQSYGRVPDMFMEVGETFQTGFTARVSGTYEGVNLELVKQEDGWKIRRYYPTQ